MFFNSKEFLVLSLSIWHAMKVSNKENFLLKDEEYESNPIKTWFKLELMYSNVIPESNS